MLAAQGVTITASTGDDGVAGSGCNCDSSESISYSNCACNYASGTPKFWKGNNTWSGKLLDIVKILFISKIFVFIQTCKGNGYFPSYPATSPYVTAVGATMGISNVIPDLGEKEKACQVSPSRLLMMK
jgi:hypothetical protein